MAETNGATLTANQENRQLRTMVRALLAERSQILAHLGLSFDGERNLYETFGYKESPGYDDYWAMYRRNEIAHCIIEAFPAATWRRPPTIRERRQPGVSIPVGERSGFEQDCDMLTTDPALAFWDNIHRVDRLACLGEYAVLLVGVQGETNLTQPLAPRTDGKLLFLAPYSQKHAVIHALVTDTNNPRFGLPESYRIDLTRGRGSKGSGPQTGMSGDRVVHASRVIHVVENPIEDAVYGPPKLESILNRLMDLEKILGASAESFFQDVQKLLAYLIRPEANFDPDDPKVKEKTEQNIADFTHRRKRHIVLGNMDIKELLGTIASPADHVDKILEVIAGNIRMPKRRLVGSERGELASGQDEMNWNSTIAERQQIYAGPRLLHLLLQFCMFIGAVRRPALGFDLEWQPESTLGPETEARIAQIKTQAFVQYAESDRAQILMPPPYYLRDVMALTDDRVEQILEESARLLAADDADDEVLDDDDEGQRATMDNEEGEEEAA